VIRGLISRLSVRLRFLVRGRRDQDLRDELELHLELLEEERRARGEASAEARAAARRQFGNAMRIQETSRDFGAHQN
jgi:hypothetical protein